MDMILTLLCSLLILSVFRGSDNPLEEERKEGEEENEGGVDVKGGGLSRSPEHLLSHTHTHTHTHTLSFPLSQPSTCVRACLYAGMCVCGYLSSDGLLAGSAHTLGNGLHAKAVEV